MAGVIINTARNLRAAFILSASFALASLVWAGSATNSNTGQASPSNKPVQQKPQPAVKPLWTDLTPAQQQALAPLAGEWDRLEPHRKTKWLAIGNKFAAMKPEEQQRLQERMRDWVKLTPEQRRTARESYARSKKLNPDQKSAHWEKYQQLPDEQKKILAQDATSRKRVATLPRPTAQNKTIPPIKSAPKPVLEKSVTPGATNQSPLQHPEPQPGK